MTFSTADGLIRAAAGMVLNHGVVSAPRGMKVLELCAPTVLTLCDVHRPFMASPVRRPNYRFGLAEAAWILSGSQDAKLIGEFNKEMLKFSDDGARMWGAYGPRLIGQLPHVIRSLKSDADSRQAVITTWRPMVPKVNVDSGEDADDCESAGMVAANAPSSGLATWDDGSWKTKDVPCTVAWHFQLRAHKLNLTVFMRSNDVWLGLPYDILSFTTVQRVVAAMLGEEVGQYNHVVSNLHLYEPHWEQAHHMAYDEPLLEVQSMPEIACDDFVKFNRKRSDVDQMAIMFGQVFVNGGTSVDWYDWMKPFIAAIHKRPDLWDGWRPLSRANGRGKAEDSTPG